MGLFFMHLKHETKILKLQRRDPDVDPRLLRGHPDHRRRMEAPPVVVTRPAVASGAIVALVSRAALACPACADAQRRRLDAFRFFSAQ